MFTAPIPKNHLQNTLHKFHPKQEDQAYPSKQLDIEDIKTTLTVNPHWTDFLVLSILNDMYAAALS